MFTPFQNFADLCLKNYSFFLISRLPLKNHPFLRGSGYQRDISFDREWGDRAVGMLKWFSLTAQLVCCVSMKITAAVPTFSLILGVHLVMVTLKL